MTFAGVAGLALLAVLGLVLGLPASIGRGLPVASLRERLQTAGQPAILLTLLVTTLWGSGAYTVYTYLASVVEGFTTLHGSHIGYVLFTWGASAALGVVIGGHCIDRAGPRAVVMPSLAAMAAAFALLSASACWLSPAAALLPILGAIVVWGIAHWAFYPAQQATLIKIAGLKGTPITLSLNASFMYLGFSLGAALGSLTIALSSPATLGWVAGACEIAALALTMYVEEPH
jgi:predicted MFS family arabinose efflux permease